MTNEAKYNYLHHKDLTPQALLNLQDRGYKFLQIQGFTIDHHAEYVEPNYFMLVPIRELPTNPEKMDIYEPINSELLANWAKDGNFNQNTSIFLADVKN